MAARSVWKGHIKFSLVSIPVKMFNALVIAQHRENRLIDRGRVGSGISTKVLGDLLSLLYPLTEKNGVTWVDPSLQIEVTYFEETEGGHFRFPVFKRIVG